MQIYYGIYFMVPDSHKEGSKNKELKAFLPKYT